MVKKRKSAAQRVSRNRKTYWKKGVDVSDVEKFAETQRENERLGFAEKSDAELFFVHKGTSDGNGNDPSPHGSSKNSVIERVELKCFQNLKPNSAVPPFLEQKRGFKVTKRKQEKRLKKLTKTAASRAPKIIRNSTKDLESYDLWEDKKSEYPFLPPDVELGYLRATKRLLPKVPDSCKQITTKLPAVEHPHPGQSYNPAYDDHQDLLKQAIASEAKKISSEQGLLKRLEMKGEPATAATAFAELVEGLDLLKPKKKDENPEEDEEDDEINQNDDDKTCDDQSESINKNHVTSEKSSRVIIGAENRKLTKARRRELLEKLKKEEKVQEKLNKKRLNDVFRVRSLLREIKSGEKRTNEKMAKKLKEKEEKLLKPSTLSRHKYEEPEVPLNLGTEIGGSMRLLKPDGNLMEDRFKSLQRRNVVETRALHLKYSRKYALKKYQVRNSEVTADYMPR